MFYQNELQFLQDTLKKSHIKSSVIPSQELAEAICNTQMQAIFGTSHSTEESRQLLQLNLEAQTVYKLIDAFGFCYIYLLLPAPVKPNVLLIGPYLSARFSAEQLLEIGANAGVSPKSQRYLQEYYQALPVLSEGNPLFFMLDTFCERIWNSPSFAIVDIHKKNLLPASPINTPQSNNFDDILVNMKTMEQRYAFENELMQAISLGQLHKEKQLLAAFSEQAFEKRVADPLRNAKNYCIIMNTLLRKAAENGGVHPVYLDNVSSTFALKIEQLPSTSETATLMREMFRSYCRLVRKHAIEKFSLVVQKTLLLIDSDLSADLSPCMLAANQNLSLGYLSTIFKKETGKTLSEHIREKRIKHAAHLLSTTQLQVQTIALYCGIMDVQYFSKLFRKEMGLTPKEYREAAKK